MHDFIDILRGVRNALDDGMEPVQAFVWCGRVHFRIDASWSLSVSPDSMSRIRLDLWRGRRRCASLWALRGDQDRLADLARSAKAEIAAVAA